VALQESIDLVRAAYDAYNKGDLDTLIGCYAPDAEMEIQVLGQTHYGQAAIRKSFEDFFEVVESPQTEPLEFIEEGEIVVVPVHIMGRLRHTGITDEMMRTDMVHAFEVRDGKIVWNYICVERDDAITAAGLRE
jgi:ketosteroid isomerase-like protein